MKHTVQCLCLSVSSQDTDASGSAGEDTRFCLLTPPCPTVLWIAVQNNPSFSPMQNAFAHSLTTGFRLRFREKQNLIWVGRGDWTTCWWGHHQGETHISAQTITVLHGSKSKGWPAINVGLQNHTHTCIHAQECLCNTVFLPNVALTEVTHLPVSKT